jgi:hypothetical protein
MTAIDTLKSHRILDIQESSQGKCPYFRHRTQEVSKNPMKTFVQINNVYQSHGAEDSGSIHPKFLISQKSLRIKVICCCEHLEFVINSWWQQTTQVSCSGGGKWRLHTSFLLRRRCPPKNCLTKDQRKPEREFEM